MSCPFPFARAEQHLWLRVDPDNIDHKQINVCFVFVWALCHLLRRTFPFVDPITEPAERCRYTMHRALAQSQSLDG